MDHITSLNMIKSIFAALGAKTSDINYAVPLLNKTTAEPKGYMDMASLASVLGERILFSGAGANVLDEGTDLDNLTIPGFYVSPNSAISKTIVNGPPTTVQFVMWVFRGRSSDYFWQIVMHKSTLYMRYNGGTADWGSWKKLVYEEATTT